MTWLSRKLIAKSLNRWARVTSLRFIEVSSPSEADIKISAEPQFHGDEDFDGPGHFLAHSLLPPFGIVHLDDAEQFVNPAKPIPRKPEDDIDFQEIIMHELGHILGLGHNPDQANIMYHNVKGRRRLGPGDIASIQKAYGMPVKGATLSPRVQTLSRGGQPQNHRIPSRRNFPFNKNGRIKNHRIPSRRNFPFNKKQR